MSYWCANGVIHLFVHCVFIVHLVSCANGAMGKTSHISSRYFGHVQFFLISVSMLHSVLV